MRISPKCVFCFLNTDIQIGTLFWGKYQVLSCPTQIKNLKISNEADLKKNCFHPHSLLATGRGEPGRREGKNLWLKPTTVWLTGLRVPWPLPGASWPCDGHQPLNALWLKPSTERTAKSKERQEVEAGSISSKTKRQQTNHLLFPGEPTLQLCSAGHCSRRWVSGAPRAVTWALTAAWNQPREAGMKCCSLAVKPCGRERRR